MIQKTTRMTMKDVQDERLFGTNIIKCGKCGIVICELELKIREHIARCAKCFSEIEDCQEENIVTEQELLGELNV